MSQSLLGRLTALLFKGARTASNAHLAESVLTGNAKGVQRSVTTRLRNKAKTALWRVVSGRRRR